jgi:hypothetical protein
LFEAWVIGVEVATVASFMCASEIARILVIEVAHQKFGVRIQETGTNGLMGTVEFSANVLVEWLLCRSDCVAKPSCSKTKCDENTDLDGPHGSAPESGRKDFRTE